MVGGHRDVAFDTVCENPKHFASKTSDGPNSFGSRLANNACGIKVCNPNTVQNR